MKNAVDSTGSESRSGDEVVPLPQQRDGAETVTFAPFQGLNPSGTDFREPAEESVAVDEKERTVISKLPVAAPEEFFRSVPLTRLAALLEGKELDHFAVQQMIGGGGMGAVFRGLDQRLDRTVAIKVIPASKRDPETLRRFRLEAQAAARLDHPNIARVYFIGEAEQWNYIVFEYIDGINVRELVEHSGPLSIDDAVFFTRQVAEALQHAQDREVVHRDIKPSNVLVTPSGMVKVVDMGLARDTSLNKSSADMTASGMTLGTFDYISPEQARNPRDADVRSDLYSLGCTLFYMLTGQPPFPDGTALQKLLNHGSQPPPDPRAWRDDVSELLMDILMKLMAKRPADRYQKPIDLVNDLLLLAEAEDLPRSQAASTLLISPSVAQRSLLEANLAWIVATLVLVGSTLWLQSVQSLSEGFLIPEPRFNSVAINSESAASEGELSNEVELQMPKLVPPALSGLASEASANGLPSSAAMRDTSGTGEAQALQVTGGANSGLASSSAASNIKSSRVVVSTVRPPGVLSSQWESSLERAIQASVGTTLIEIVGTVLVDQPIQVAGRDIELRGDGVSSRIEIQSSLLSDFAKSSEIFSLSDSKLIVRDLSLQLVTPMGMASSGSVFSIQGRSSLELQSTQATIVGELLGKLHVVSIDNVERGGTVAPDPMANSIGVSIKDCVLRGTSSMFEFRNSGRMNGIPIEVSVSDSLIAMEGVTADFGNPVSSRSIIKGASPSIAALESTANANAGQMVRFFASQSTFVANQGFAHLHYEEGAMPSLGLDRTAQNCVFWSETGNPHITVFGYVSDLAENSNLLFLQGYGNSYDEQVRDLCWMRAADVYRYSFVDGKQEGWFIERAISPSVQWSRNIGQMRRFYDTPAEDFVLVRNRLGMFVPGFPGKISD